MWTIKDVDRAESLFPNEALYICTTCFRLTSFNRNWVRCFCEPAVEVVNSESFDPSWVVLCVLCARAVCLDRMGWKDKGCPSCVRFNGQLKGRIGINLVMSRVDPAAYVLAQKFEPDEIARKKATNAFDRMKQDWERIFAWSLCLARELWESAPEWGNEKYIGTYAWELKFPHSPAISEQMLLRMSGYKTMTALREAIERLETGDETTPETDVIDIDKRTFFKIPEGIAEMSDDEIHDWSLDVYRQFVSLNPAPSTEVSKGGDE